MVGTPLVARAIHLDIPHAAPVYEGLMGTTSRVARGLVSTDPELIPIGAMTATAQRGIGCVLAPSVLYLAARAVM